MSFVLSSTAARDGFLLSKSCSFLLFFELLSFSRLLKILVPTVDAITNFSPMMKFIIYIVIIIYIKILNPFLGSELFVLLGPALWKSPR